MPQPRPSVTYMYLILNLRTVEPFQFETSAETESVDPIPFRHLEMEWGPHSHFQQRSQIRIVRQYCYIIEIYLIVCFDIAMVVSMALHTPFISIKPLFQYSDETRGLKSLPGLIWRRALRWSAKWTRPQRALRHPPIPTTPIHKKLDLVLHRRENLT